ncbi:hypothetical protein HETIRDRAFT_101017 [Heterobasidion irregulare TC 32-1]|uniref:Uncharacterized protein n=1 Tax=Heterobasidion irregulare (strain TC 32-1) TaxID=747525 RepID=W4KJR8_HETIT|nr:uncharacterized protein HETIRDRAFT_101017 [Heterobasidion irregulare TC 32-1]ETW85276.1 hypothetical protein HETIRDRAFT_101017 [Heterobasidion irregulare TC 32-1]
MSFQLGNSDPIEMGVITIVELGGLVVGILHKLTYAIQAKHADEHAPVLGSKEVSPHPANCNPLKDV